MTEANEVLRPVHDRMPVILHTEDYEPWLEADARKIDLVREMLRPYPVEEMTGYPVGLSVKSPRNQGTGLVERATFNPA